MTKDSFSDYHPVVNLLYFMAVIGFSMFLMHPVTLGISLLCAAFYAVKLNGRKALRAGFLFLLPMLLLAAAINPLFNHRGATILGFLPNGNPLTLEAIVYGFAAATMLVTVMIWFFCFNRVMESDKMVYLFGRVIPSMSLILSMSLRFVPRFRKQITVIANAQKNIGKDVSRGNALQRMRNGIKILSILVTWALENAVDTADSMKARGYGLPGRTAFSLYRFQRRDAKAAVFILLCAVMLVAGAFFELYQFRYFPTLRGAWTGLGTVLVFVVYFMLGALPLWVAVPTRRFSYAAQ